MMRTVSVKKCRGGLGAVVDLPTGSHVNRAWRDFLDGEGRRCSCLEPMVCVDFLTPEPVQLASDKPSTLWRVFLKEILHSIGLRHISGALHRFALCLGGQPAFEGYKGSWMNGVYARHASVAPTITAEKPGASNRTLARRACAT